eukprot:CAMPEP_0181296490 /NCGR_PEP_ID=MMETSP1101-20121128/4734_1 /TAXON_ID=46948 /ORGANISM="Rhodomonas abbreviata, Strain Caron Lab Isolate" /LENGTH=120 /DNA_ID=CAMNT_0023401363 /DNA_START=235 /DNA_END=597 /DNA_ORIENTATION=+
MPRVAPLRKVCVPNDHLRVHAHPHPGFVGSFDDGPVLCEGGMIHEASAVLDEERNRDDVDCTHAIQLDTLLALRQVRLERHVRVEHLHAAAFNVRNGLGWPVVCPPLERECGRVVELVRS